MASLNILIGGDSFKKIREEHRCYVDKTSFIEEFFALGQPEVSLITRPRRFGKTLMMTMLKEFFDIKQATICLQGLPLLKTQGFAMPGCINIQRYFFR
ncbi:MAG: AAA family ATPase [Desulfovibrio sp.]|nr:AAA family ATPase [Desulfovibrio sp.]